MNVKDESEELNEVEEKHQLQKPHNLKTEEKSSKVESVSFRKILSSQTGQNALSVGGSFSQRGNLEMHINIDTGEKP